MLCWNGACIVHDEFKGLELELLREQHPGALVLVHPESPRSVVEQADVVGSTSALIKAVRRGQCPGLHRRHRQRHPAPHAPAGPGKTLIEAPTAGNSATCKSCAHCPWMAMNGLANLVACLESGQPQIQVDEPIRAKAQGCITRMLDFVAAHKAKAAGMKAGIGAA